MTDTPASAIKRAVDEVEDAISNYERLNAAESAARKEATEGLNRLNAAQKKLDAAVSDLYRSAPARSDWAQRNRRGTPEQ